MNFLFKANSISVSRPTLTNDQLTNDDYYEGVLLKQSPSFHKMWQRRYFVLRNRMLFYYKSKQYYNDKRSIKGVLNF